MLEPPALSEAAAALYATRKRKSWEDSTVDTVLPGWRDGPEQAGIQQAYIAGRAMQAEGAVTFALSEESRTCTLATKFGVA